MGIPEEDRIPYRHPYGDYTHLPRDGRYKFEWTPFTPAVDAWRNAQSHLGAALDHLADAHTLPGFGLNGLAEQHVKMIDALSVLAQDTRASRDEAGKVADVLDAANRDYAVANEASPQEYQSLVQVIDLVQAGQSGVHNVQDQFERDFEAQRDHDVFPFDPPPPSPPPPAADPGGPSTQNHVHGKGF